MAKPMTKSEAQAFQKRWRRVNDMEKRELRQTSMELKFRQLAALMASAKQLGWDEALAEGEAEVRDRWMRLRKAYLSRVQDAGDQSRKGS